jgi:hypothetical protein
MAANCTPTSPYNITVQRPLHKPRALLRVPDNQCPLRAPTRPSPRSEQMSAMRTKLPFALYLFCLGFRGVTSDRVL